MIEKPPIMPSDDGVVSGNFKVILVGSVVGQGALQDSIIIEQMDYYAFLPPRANGIDIFGFGYLPPNENASDSNIIMQPGSNIIVTACKVIESSHVFLR